MMWGKRHIAASLFTKHVTHPLKQMPYQETIRRVPFPDKDLIKKDFSAPDLPFLYFMQGLVSSITYMLLGRPEELHGNGCCEAQTNER
jgi:hypothetical protein